MPKLVQLEQPSLGEKMLCAGISACAADIMTFPFDVAKVRLQLLGEAVSSGAVSNFPVQSVAQRAGLLGTMIGMVRSEGVKSLYGGIGPGLQRQCVFASIRIGFYDSVKDFYSNQLPIDGNGTGRLMTVRIMSGVTTGAVGILVAQPTDVVKVRMQAQRRSLVGGVSQPKYANSWAAYTTIYKTEGFKGLWKGLGPNVARNSVVNTAELVCYDSIKDLLLKKRWFNDGLPCHLTAAFSAGFCATIFASPIDVVKTRYMNAGPGTYSSVWHCAKCLVREGGLLAFYKGFTPSFIRLGTWNICMFVTFEQLKKLASQMKLNEAGKDKADNLLSIGRTAAL